MSRLDSLRELYDAVKAGTLPDDLVEPAAFKGDFQNGYRCVQAYHGSVDAALAFIAATLPGWEWHLGPSNAKIYPYNGDPRKSWDGMADNPATALLLAGLAALIAGEEGK